MLVFVKGEKPETPEKNSRSKTRINKKLNTHTAMYRNQTRAKLLGGDRSHHSSITGIFCYQSLSQDAEWTSQVLSCMLLSALSCLFSKQQRKLQADLESYLKEGNSRFSTADNPHTYFYTFIVSLANTVLTFEHVCKYSLNKTCNNVMHVINTTYPWYAHLSSTIAYSKIGFRCWGWAGSIRST